MFILSCKLKALKNSLRGLAKLHFLGLHKKFLDAKDSLYKFQTKNFAFLGRDSVLKQEKILRNHYCQLVRMEFEDTVQKIRCDWMRFGDMCNKFFFNSIQENKGRNSINALVINGELCYDKEVIKKSAS